MPTWIRSVVLAGLGLTLVAIPGRILAVELSPDVSLVVDGRSVDDEDAVTLDGAATLANLGTLPAFADLDGYWDGDGFALFSLDTSASLSGTTVAPGDVVRFQSGSYTLEWDASANGVPATANCDAVARDLSGRLLLSFDTSVSLPGGLLVDDEDVVRVDGIASFTLLLDASATGISSALDLDAVDVLPDGRLVASFDGSGTVDGVVFDDEDALLYDGLYTLSWGLDTDASQVAAWGGADADAIALPEPGPATALLAGVGSLLALGRRRGGRS